MTTKKCRFDTERLLVGEWHSLSADDWNEKDLIQFVCDLLTPAVTEELPESWQGPFSVERAGPWIVERDDEGAMLLVIERASQDPIGMMTLFEGDVDGQIRLGYLLSESVWGQGYGTELVQGFVEWCKASETISVFAGVSRSNVASQRVLIKGGFKMQQNAADSDQLFFELLL